MANQNDRLIAIVKRYLDNHCANADAEGMSTLCECKVCTDARTLIAEIEDKEGGK